MTKVTLCSLNKKIQNLSENINYNTSGLEQVKASAKYSRSRIDRLLTALDKKENEAACNHNYISIGFDRRSGWIDSVPAKCASCGKAFSKLDGNWIGWLTMRRIRKVFGL